jgi:BirA family biotin operon repressor/biotin-[acetyl-CoA-carboxylase] ligase
MGPLHVSLAGQVASTQDELWAKRRWAADGTGIAASSQTAGRGRGGAVWVSPEGGIYLSILMGRGLPAADADLLGVAAALAVHRACSEFLKGDDLFVKWPNDVVTWGPGRKIGKLAGVLVRLETERDRVIQGLVGVGVNVRETVDSMALEEAEVAPVSLEGLSKRRGVEWNAPRTKVLEWVVGWCGAYLARAREDPDSLRREFAHEVAQAPLRARVPGVSDELKPLGVDAQGQLQVRRRNGDKATVSVADAERLRWKILAPPKAGTPKAAPRKKPAKPKARGARARRASRR